MEEKAYIGDYKYPPGTRWLGLVVGLIFMFATFKFYDFSDSYKTINKVFGYAGIVAVWATFLWLMTYIEWLDKSLRDCFTRYKNSDDSMKYYRDKCG